MNDQGVNGFNWMMQSLGQGYGGGLAGGLGMQQAAALANYVYTNTTTTATQNPPGVPLPKGASPADPPEYLWLKRRIEDICWVPS